MTARVTGVPQVIAKLQRTNAAQRVAVFAAVHRLGDRLEANVKGTWLSGRALHRRSGRLASSVNNKFTTTATAAKSSVGTNSPYGRGYELEFRGTVNVQGFTRTVSSRSTFGQVALSKARLSKSGRIITSSRRKVSEGITFVRAHQRRVDMSGHRFLAPALDELRPSVESEIRAALVTATNENA